MMHFIVCGILVILKYLCELCLILVFVNSLYIFYFFDQ